MNFLREISRERNFVYLYRYNDALDFQQTPLLG